MKYTQNHTHENPREVARRINLLQPFRRAVNNINYIPVLPVA